MALVQRISLTLLSTAGVENKGFPLLYMYLHDLWMVACYILFLYFLLAINSLLST